MKKTEKISSFLFILVLFAFVGCYSDKGSNEYHELVELKIEGLKKDSIINILTNTSDTLKINPKIESTSGEEFIENNYTFVWKYQLGDEIREISTERALKYPINIPTGGYYFYLLVTEKSTGVQYNQSYYVQVSNLYSKGMLVLCEDSEQYAKLDMVSYLEKDTIILRNITEELNVPKYKNPVLIFAGASYSNHGVHISTKEGTYILNRSDLSFNPVTDLLKYKMGAPGKYWEKAELMTICDPAGRNRYAIIDNYFFGCDLMQGAIWGYPINIYSGELTHFKIAKNLAFTYKASNNYGAQFVAYDLEAKRFANLKDSYGGVAQQFKPLNNTVSDLPIFDWNTGLDFVTTFHSFFGSIGESTTILTDSKGTYYAYRYSVPYSSAITKTGRYDISDAVDLDKAKLFFASAEQPYIFYTVGSKIHGYDLSNGKKYCYEKDMGEEITAIFDSPFAAQYGSKLTERGKDFIYIATYGGTPGSGKITKLHIVDSPDKVELEPVLFGEVKEGDTVIKAGEPVVWTGFDKIVSMIFQ